MVARKLAPLFFLIYRTYLLPHASCKNHPAGLTATSRVLDLTAAAALHGSAGGFVNPPWDPAQSYCNFGCDLGVAMSGF